MPRARAVVVDLDQPTFEKGEDKMLMVCMKPPQGDKKADANQQQDESQNRPRACGFSDHQ
jgi:hypothetical protein